LSNHERSELDGQVALVTGGGRGLGRAFALALAAQGAAVAVTARSADQLGETLRLIEGSGGRAIAIPGDVSDKGAVQSAVSATEEQLGPVDLLVNNAGVSGHNGPAWEVDSDEWKRVIEVNLFGPFLYTRAVLPGMVARRHGRIINISSGAGWRPAPYGSEYGASKAALTHMTNTIAREVDEYGISVLAYSPGFVRTAMADTVLSPNAHALVREKFNKIVEDGQVVPIERTVEKFMFLASGRADGLSGCLISVADDEVDLLRRADEIRRDDLYTVRLRT